MKIIDEAKAVRFDDIEFGETFRWSGSIYLKGKDISSPTSFVAVSIYTGTIRTILPSEVVKPVDGTFVVDYKK